MEGDAYASVIVELSPSDESPSDELACVWTWHELCDRRSIGCTMNVGSLSGPFSALHCTLSEIGIVLLMMSVTYILHCQRRLTTIGHEQSPSVYPDQSCTVGIVIYIICAMLWYSDTVDHDKVLKYHLMCVDLWVLKSCCRALMTMILCWVMVM